MSVIPLDLQRRFERRWAVRAGNPGCTEERRIERLSGQRAPHSAKTKEKPAGLKQKPAGVTAVVIFLSLEANA
jgi:hypothetical protein